MSRSLTTVAVLLPAVRALVDAVDAVDAIDELAHRFTVDPLGVHGQAGEWDLDGEVSLSRFGLGVVVERDTPDAPGWSNTTTIKVHAGPIAVSATRYRPSRARAVPQPADCALGGPLGDDFPCCEGPLENDLEKLRAAGYIS